MNILLVIADLGLGGAQQVVINLANELERQNHKVWIFDIKPGLRTEGMVSRINEKVTLISRNSKDLKLNLFERAFSYIKNKFSIKTKIKDIIFKKHEKRLKFILLFNKIDFINSHICWADFYVSRSLKKHHDKWIISLHASYNNLFSHYPKEFLEISKTALLNAKKIIYIHDAGIAEINKTLGIKLKNTKKIYNGICEIKSQNNIKRKNLGLTNDDIVILCASRAIKEKGWFELSEAFSKLNNKKMKLIFAGDGLILKDIKEMYSFNKSILFLGFQKYINDIIKLSDIVCLPSYSEALPTIIIESIYNKKHIIATEVGEVNNMLNNKFGNCGILIKNYKGKKLANELLINLKKFSKNEIKLNESSLNYAIEVFAIKKMAENYINLIKTKV